MNRNFILKTQDIEIERNREKGYIKLMVIFIESTSF